VKIHKEKLFVSTVADNAVSCARDFGLGLEIAEYCTAYNMDAPDFAEVDAAVRQKLADVPNAGLTFHAPFNELCPAAIEPRVREVTRERILQAAELAAGYGAKKIVVHSGYVPLVYFKGFFVEQSVLFWKQLLTELPKGLSLAVENVLEDEPDGICEIVRQVGDPRLGMCLDVGHANTIVSELPVLEWCRRAAPVISHLHIHNNTRTWDHHAPLGDGMIDYAPLLELLLENAPEATFTIESIDAYSSAVWLREHGFLE
jgi:sugar phosphate isomerase/epimerase